MRRFLVVLLVACGGKGGGTPVDSHAGSADAPAGGQDGAVDSPTAIDAAIDAPAVACTGALYDPCTDPSQCTSNDCKLFMGSMFQVCTQACTPGDNTTCPKQGNAVVTCNNMGICKPPGPNVCTP